MNQGHTFRVVAWWSSGQTGIVKSDSAPNAVHFTAPVAFGGYEGRWTPEDLFLGAIASSFTTTCRALADQSGLEYTDLQVEVEGTMNPTSVGFRFGGVVIRVNLTIAQEAQRERGFKLLDKAKEVCPIFQTLAIQPSLDRVVMVGVPAPA